MKKLVNVSEVTDAAWLLLSDAQDEMMSLASQLEAKVKVLRDGKEPAAAAKVQKAVDFVDAALSNLEAAENALCDDPPEVGTADTGKDKRRGSGRKAKR